MNFKLLNPIEHSMSFGSAKPTKNILLIIVLYLFTLIAKYNYASLHTFIFISIPNDSMICKSVPNLTPSKPFSILLSV